MNWCNDNRIAINKLAVLLSAAMAVLFLMTASYFQFKSYQSGVNEVLYRPMVGRLLVYLDSGLEFAQQKKQRESKKRFS